MNANNPAAEDEARADIRQLADAIEYLDAHDIGDELESMPEVHFEINLPPRRKFYPLEAELSEKLRGIASERGVSAETLLDLWIREKASEALAVSATK